MSRLLQPRRFRAAWPLLFGSLLEGDPREIAVTPDGTKAYVTDPGMGEMSVIDVATDSITKRIEAGLGALPRGVAIR